MAYDGSLKFDTKVDSTGFSSGISKLKSTALSAISAIGAAFASGAIAKALVTQINLVEQYGSAINDQSQKIGITTKAYQELSYIMGQVGANVDVLQTGIKTLSSAVVDGNKAFEQLGISLDEARAMSQEDLFNTVIERLASMESGTLRTSLATDLFGRSATELAPLLNMGAAGIAKMRQEAQSYGLIMTDKAVAATDAYGDAAALAQKSGEALRNALVLRMIPALTRVAIGFANIASEAATAFDERGIGGMVDVITDKFPVATAAVSGLVTALTAMMIVKILTPLVVALQTAQVQLALAMMGTTAAAVAESGALTLTEVVVGIFTGKLAGATAATALFNATIAANPVMAIAVAIGLLVGAVVLATKHFDELNPEIAQTREELKALNKQIDESSDAFKDSISETEKQRAKFDGLIDTLAELSSAYSGSSIEQAQMQTICNTLNGSVDGLSVSFDAQTGKLTQTTSAMHDLVAAQYDAAKSSAALKRYEEILGEQIDAEFEQRKAYAEWSKYHDTTTGKRFSYIAFGKSDNWVAAVESEKNMRKANETLAETSENTQEFIVYMDELGVTYVKAADSATTAAGATEGFGDAAGGAAKEVARIVIAGVDVTDVLDGVGVSADGAASRLDTFTAAATNMFGRISEESKTTVREMIDNLLANKIAIENWGENISFLGSILPADLLQPLIDQGPEKMAGAIAALADATPDELAELAEAFSKGGVKAKEAWLLSLGVSPEEIEAALNPKSAVLEFGSTPTYTKYGVTGQKIPQYGVTGLPIPTIERGAEQSVADAAEQSVADAKNAMDSAVQSTDFESVGELIATNVASGLAVSAQEYYDAGVSAMAEIVRGIASQSAEIMSGVRDINTDMVEEIRGAGQEFYDAGIYVAEQFEAGYMGHRAKLVAAARELALAVNRAFFDNIDLTLPGVTYGKPTIKKNGTTTTTSTPIASTLSDVPQGAGGATGGTYTLGSIARVVPLSSAGTILRDVVPTSGGTTITVPITVQGVVESDARLARRVAREFQEVVLYGNR